MAVQFFIYTYSPLFLMLFASFNSELTTLVIEILYLNLIQTHSKKV